MYLFPHLILQHPYKIGIIIIIPILEKRKLRPGVVLTLAEVTQAGRGELQYLTLERLSAVLHSRELGPVSFLS